MTAFSYGSLDGTQLLRPSHRDDRFEMLGIDKAERRACPIPWKGMNLSTTGAAGKPPSALEDGIFISLESQSTSAGSGYGTDPFGTTPAGMSTAHGSKFYDIAANVNTVPVFMVFSGDTAIIAGAANNMYLNDADGVVTATRNPNYVPGDFNSETVTGLKGSFRAWVPARLTSELSLAGYAAGDSLTILNGRIKKAITGDMVVDAL